MTFLFMVLSLVDQHVSAYLNMRGVAYPQEDEKSERLQNGVLLFVLLWSIVFDILVLVRLYR